MATASFVLRYLISLFEHPPRYKNSQDDDDNVDPKIDENEERRKQSVNHVIRHWDMCTMYVIGEFLLFESTLIWSRVFEREPLPSLNSIFSFFSFFFFFFSRTYEILQMISWNANIDGQSKGFSYTVPVCLGRIARCEVDQKILDKGLKWVCENRNRTEERSERINIQTL